MQLPDLNDVRIFVEVGQAGTLTAAAREMHLPTSTVSRALTRLEKHLGVLLAQRSRRRLAMTDFGRDYLQTCRRAMRTLKEGHEMLESRRESPSGLVSRYRDRGNVRCVSIHAPAWGATANSASDSVR